MPAIDRPMSDYAIVDPDEVQDVYQGTDVPGEFRRNEADEPVEMWAISRRIDGSDATKIDDFWAASPDAEQRRGGDD